MPEVAYVVKNGCTILLPNGGGTLKPGTPISENGEAFDAVTQREISSPSAGTRLRPEHIKDHLASGFIKRYNQGDEQIIRPEDLTDNVPGQTETPALSGKLPTDDEAYYNPDGSGVRLQAGQSAVTGQQTPEQAKMDAVLAENSQWNLHPEELAGKSLEELNALVAVRNGPPQQTVEAAVSLLGQDLPTEEQVAATPAQFGGVQQ